MGIHDVPPVVVVQLKRFVFTSASLYGPSKVGNHIGFGPTLRLDPFLSAETREVASAAGHGPVDAGLFAVVVHRGTNADSGHYYTYVKAAAPPTVMLQVPQNGGVESPAAAAAATPPQAGPVAGEGRWYRMDDILVTEVDFDEVTKDDAYLLFYS